jgi:hypothetical protein
VKPAAIILAFLLATMNLHVPVPIAGAFSLAVPLPLLAALVLVSVVAVMMWSIWLLVRRSGFSIVPCSYRGVAA